MRGTPSSPGTPVRERIIRRVFHVALSAVLVYYVLPEPILTVGGMPLPRAVGLVAFYMVAFSIEVARQARLVRLPSMRSYERQGVASYFWFASGAVLLILIFPATIAAPCIVACAVGDVVLGETRRWRRLHRLPLAWCVCAAPFLLIWQPWSAAIPVVWLLAAMSGGLSVLAESLDLRIPGMGSRAWSALRSRHPVRLDDDLVMQMVPAILLWAAFLLLTAAGRSVFLPEAFQPEWWFPTVRIG